MNIKEIMAVSGYPGLYKFVAQSSRGIIVESLTDGKRTNIPPTAKVSSMGEISVFTTGEDIPIAKIFQAVYRTVEGKEAINHKSPEGEIVAFFERSLPDYDRERVHVSDMRKIIAWYNLLLAGGLIDLDTEEEEVEG